MFRVLVVGGYGHFGGRICRALATHHGIALIVAGRNAAAARAFVATLPDAARHECVAIDLAAADFPARVAATHPHLVVHTSGPYQGQDYTVARAAITAGAHYVDLADGRKFVSEINVLDDAARARGVLVTSGASTLPALSSAVIDAHATCFGELSAVEISIAPGQQTPRGLATIAAVLSYCGKPFDVLEDGAWRTVHGWQQQHRHRYPDFGCRWLARCDVPDLDVLPRRYPSLRTVRFDAALEIAVLQWGLWMLAWITRLGIVRDWTPFAGTMLAVGRWFDPFGGGTGGMHVDMRGTGVDGRPLRLVWNLVARRGHGPEIPCIAAIVVARKLAAGKITERGAMPCMGLMTLDEFRDAVAHLDIVWRTDAVA